MTRIPMTWMPLDRLTPEDGRHSGAKAYNCCIQGEIVVARDRGDLRVPGLTSVSSPS